MNVLQISQKVTTHLAAFVQTFGPKSIKMAQSGHIVHRAKSVLGHPNKMARV